MIVEFLEGQAFLLALVLENKPHRLSVLAQNGQTMNISQSRILNTSDVEVHGDKQKRLDFLNSLAEKRQKSAQALDLAELWEILEGEGPSFAYEALAELYYGQKANPDELSALMRAIFHDQLRFKFGPEEALRFTVEEIAKAQEIKARQEKEESRAREIAAWLVAAVRGEVPMEPQEGGDEARAALIDFALYGENAKLKRSAKEYLRMAALPQDPLGALKVLQALGEFTLHENLDLRRLDLGHDFPPEALSATEELSGPFTLSHLAPKVSPDGTKRQDLTDLATITIDSAGAKDLDDALSITVTPGGWQLAVHITDVAASIPHDSILDLEARKRTSSIYMPEAKYPMFPTGLSEGKFSLILDEIRPAFSLLVDINQAGEITSSEISPSWIKIDRQLSFNEVDQIIGEDPDVIELNKLSKVLIKKREENGGLNLNLSKLSVYFAPDGRLAHGLTRWDTPAKTIVGEMMILANYLAADILLKNKIACPFRYQEKMKGTIELPTNADSDNVSLCKKLAARRQTGRSGLSFEPSPHHGLGLSVYTAFTAPMRRYLDLLVGRQLRALSLGQDPIYDQQSLLKLALPVYELGQQVQKMQNKRQRYWLTVLLADKVGQEFTALVFEQRERRLRVCLPDYMLEFDIFLTRHDDIPQLFGRKVALKLTKADPRQEILKFEWA